MELFCAALRRDSVSLLKFSFLSHVRVLLCEMLFISPLERPLSCFPSDFFSYCHSIVHRFISIVSDGCNESSIMFLYIVESFYRYVNTVFNAGKSSPSFFLGTYSLSTTFLGCKALCIVILSLLFIH